MENENENEVQAVTVTDTSKKLTDALSELSFAIGSLKSAGMLSKPAAGENAIECAFAVMSLQNEVISDLAAGLDRLKKFGFENQ